MTIEFNCPNCGALIAFDSKHAGKRAKCLECGQRFLIPSASFQKPEKVAPEPKPKEDPIPGFYRAVFLGSWGAFLNRQNVTPLAFVTAVVCLKFYVASAACCLNYVTSVVVWGLLFGYYLSIIHQTAYDEDLLPEVDVGTSITFLWHVIQPIFVFGYTLFLVELPFIITLWVGSKHGITPGQVWSGHTPLHLLMQIFQVAGLFAFPAAILTLAVGQDFTLLRPDYLLAPLFRAFLPYLTVVLLLAATCFAEMHTAQEVGKTTMETTKNLGGNLLVQVLALLSMRAIGLLYRHYGCYFKW